jgi:hypothetical protein
MAAIAIPAVVPLTDDDWFWLSVLNAPSLLVPPLGDGEAPPAPGVLPEPSKLLPGVIGMAGLM